MKRPGKNITEKGKAVSRPESGLFSRLADYSYILIILLAALCFAKVVFFGFPNYDDRFLIIDNHKTLADLSNLPRVFQHGIWGLFNLASPYDYYRPLLIVSLMIDAAIGGTSTVIYHLSNLVYHIIACLLLFRVLVKLNIKKETALVFTLLFTVHPVLTQAVAWIPGRNDILLSIFILGSLLCFIQYMQSRKIIFLAGHSILFFLGLMTKETAIALPVICFLYSSVLLKKKIIQGETLGYATVWILLSAVYFFIRSRAIGQTASILTLSVIAETIIYRLPAIFQYLGKAFFPFDLSVKPTQQDTGHLWGIAAFIGIAVTLYLSSKKNYRMIVFGVAWFLLFLMPALLIPKNLNDNLFEHRLYLPLIGLLILMNESVLFKSLVAYVGKRMWISIGVIILFAGLTFVHAGTFKEPFAFWKNAAVQSPHDAEAQFFLAKQYYNKGDTVNYVKYFQKTISLKPDYKTVNSGLAIVYAQNGEMEKAKEYYEAEIRLGTKAKEDFQGLGSVMKNLNKPDEAIASFKKALELDSTDENTNGHLAELYFGKQDYETARKIWERMLIRNPSRLTTNMSLAIMYSRTGNFERALYYGLAEEKIGGKMPAGFIEDMTRRAGGKK